MTLETPDASEPPKRTNQQGEDDARGTLPGEEAGEGSADANPKLAKRLFVLPAIVGGIIVLVLGLYFLFSSLTRESRSADAYLEDIRSGAGNRRWQAAYELSSTLESGHAEVRADTAAKALRTFQEARAASDEPRIRRYLALALGRIGDRSAVPALVDALSDPDAETRIYSALALGRMADRHATPGLVKASSDPDAGVRKAAVYALGELRDPASADRLREALHDAQVDVTWNAAIALARMNDPSGAEILRAMADRAFVDRASQTEDLSSRATVLVTAAQGLAMIGDRESLPALHKLAASDPDLRVREAAIEALKTLETPKPAE